VGWVESLQGQAVGVDTAPIIYFIQDHPIYLPAVRPFFQALDRGEFRAITSIVTLLEVLVHPFRRGDVELAQRYRDFLLSSTNLTCMVLSGDIAQEAARLRSQHNLRTADAIQMATAIHEGASSFLTNDAGLPSLPMLQMMVLNQLRSVEPTP
jgi:predicted nucleic acid-binding protein